MKRWTLVTGILLACVSAAVPATERKLEIISLQHRMVRDVLPQLQPLLAPEGTLTGDRNQLIVRTTADNLAEIRAALEALDQPASRLRISVSQSRSEASSGGRVSYRVEGNAAEASSLALEAEVIGTRSDQGRKVVQSLLTLDGQSAFIDIGQISPTPVVLGYTSTADGPSAQVGMSYQTSSSGFYVTPQVHGNTVDLALNARLQSPAGNDGSPIATHSTTVNLSGQLGEWIPVGGTMSQGHTSDYQQQGVDYALWVRVERVP